MKTVCVTSYGGIDWHDKREMSEYIKNSEGGYDISDPDDVIASHAADVFKKYSEDEQYKGKWVTEIPTKEDILGAVKNGTTISLLEGKDVWKDDDGSEHIFYETEIAFNGKEKIFSEEFCAGQISYKTYYDVKEIADSDVRYIATENFLVPQKGHPSVSRFYHYPVKTQKEAEKLLDEMVLHEGLNWAGSVKELVISDVNDLLESNWYAANILVINSLKEFEDQNNRYPDYAIEAPFHIYAKYHLEEIEKAKEQVWKSYMDSLKNVAFA